MPITESDLASYAVNGYAVVKSLFDATEVDALKSHYMLLRSQGTYPGDFDGVDLLSTDPLKRFPRMIHMHRWDKTSRDWLLDTRIRDLLSVLGGKEPYAVQTMLYFKPAGARGQALHQDQYYLRVQPGSCTAVWLALDTCDEENGCMQVVPGSHTLPVLCTEKADTTLSFTDVTVPIPPSMKAVPILMDAGDVLLFDGQLIHGSFPNTSKERFRRALIGHYISGDAKKVGGYYHPVLRFDGTEVKIDQNAGGGSCGVWVASELGPVVEMMSADNDTISRHE